MNDWRQTFLPTEEIFLSFGDDGLPIVELLVSSIIENLIEVRGLGLIIYNHIYSWNLYVSKYSCTFHNDLSKHFERHEVETKVNALKGYSTVFPTFGLTIVNACQCINAGNQTTSLSIFSVIVILSSIMTMTQFPFHRLTIILCFHRYIFTDW